MTMTRRDVLSSGLAAAAAAAVSTPAWAAAAKKNTSYFAGTAVDNGVTYRTTNFAKIDQKWHKQVVKYFSEEPQGTVVVDTRHHFLYLIMENKTAIRYGVGVGKEGFKWYGRATIDRKTLWPK
jgi:lipoprotein-anchoring transpeptidase ErfK/SrfK